MTNGTTPCISGGYTNMMTEDDSDLIRRSDALDCFHDWVDRYGDVHTPDEMAEYRAIEALPSVEPTLYGYNIEHLELIARVLQKEDLPPERVAEALTDIGRIVAIVNGESEEALRKAVEQWMI